VQLPSDDLLERARELLDLTPALLRYAKEVQRRSFDTRGCSRDLCQQTAGPTERLWAAGLPLPRRDR
jgi:hypothetical protein